MKIGMQIGMFKWPGGDSKIGETLAKATKTADEAGFESIWVMDHFFQLEPMLGKAEDPMMEAYTTLGFMAAHSKKAKLGTMVTGAIYREPGLLLKAMTSLDVLSGGRSYFGVGAGWYEREAKGLGFEFLKHIERTKLLLIMLDITSQSLENDYVSLINELKSYSDVLVNYPRIIAVNKIDVMKDKTKDIKIAENVHYISALKGIGIQEILKKILDIFKSMGGKNAKGKNKS